MMGQLAPSHTASFPMQSSENTNTQAVIPKEDKANNTNVATRLTKVLENYMISSFPELNWSNEKLASRLELGLAWT